MKSHRMLGVALIVAGLFLLGGQLKLLYGGIAEQNMMVAIGLPGVAVLSAAGAACVGIGSLLATAPRATVHHIRRAANALRRRKGA